jgi:hypothetical protein
MSIRVLPIAPFEVEPWLLEKHYAKRIPSISYAFGAYIDNELVGIVTYGTSASSTLRFGVCGKKWEECVIELNRLVCVNEKNMASQLIGSGSCWLCLSSNKLSLHGVKCKVS